MKLVKNLISLYAIILMASSMNLQSMEVGENDYGVLNAKGQECYEQLLHENKNDVTKALLQITKKFETFVSEIEEPQALAIVERLIKEDANVNGVSEFKITPLMYAVRNYNINLAQVLISSGAYVNGNSIKDLTPIDGYTPLMKAVQINDLNMVKFLIEKCHADINYKDLRNKQTPLCIATHFAEASTKHQFQIPIIQFLLCNGADYTIPDSQGITPLNIAQQYSNKTIENLLLTGEYNPVTDQSERSDRQRRRNLGLSVMRSSFSTPNRWQTQPSPSSLREQATSSLSTTQSTETRSGQSSQGEEHSTTNGHTFMSQRPPFQPAGIELGIQIRNDFRRNLLSDENQSRERNIIPVSIHGSGLAPSNLWSNTESQQPAERYPKQSRHNWKNIQELCSKLQEPSESPNPELKEFINQLNKKTGKTLLMRAARRGDILLIKRLLKQGADAGIFDKNKKTALDYACENKHKWCIEALIIPTGLALSKQKDRALYEKQLN
jgi:ankyrin repeat protein